MEENKKFRQMEPTKIVYKPHCGNCGFPIDTSENKIAYQEVYDYAKVDTIIHPRRCANCGALFNSIQIPMPKQLPDIFLGE